METFYTIDPGEYSGYRTAQNVQDIMSTGKCQKEGKDTRVLKKDADKWSMTDHESVILLKNHSIKILCEL